MRTVDECNAILDNAKSDGIIADWKQFYQRSTDFYRPCWVEIKFKDGYHKACNFGTRGEAQNWGADYVLSLYPKESGKIDCTVTVDDPQGLHEWMKARFPKDVPVNNFTMTFHQREIPCRWGDSEWVEVDKSGDVVSVNVDGERKSFTGQYAAQQASTYVRECMRDCWKNKEKTVEIKLSEAVHSIMADPAFTQKAWIIVWGDNHVAVGTVVDAMRKWQRDSIYQRPIAGFTKMPYPMEVERADIIIHVTGGPTGMTLEITKNRHGKMRRFDCMADCYFKESNMNQNDVEKAWPYNHLHCDSAGYAECFRILREAKKDGVIDDWYYAAKMPDGPPGIDVYPVKGHGFESFRDKDGTKGDIGLLREAADYVMGLKKKAEKPDPKDMSARECMAEIKLAGMDMGHGQGSLLPILKNGPINVQYMYGDETYANFLRRCVEYIRGLKA